MPSKFVSLQPVLNVWVEHWKVTDEDLVVVLSISFSCSLPFCGYRMLSFFYSVCFYSFCYFLLFCLFIYYFSSLFSQVLMCFFHPMFTAHLTCPDIPSYQTISFIPVSITQFPLLILLFIILVSPLTRHGRVGEEREDIQYYERKACKSCTNHPL